MELKMRKSIIHRVCLGKAKINERTLHKQKQDALSCSPPEDYRSTGAVARSRDISRRTFPQTLPGKLDEVDCSVFVFKRTWLASELCTDLFSLRVTGFIVFGFWVTGCIFIIILLNKFSFFKFLKSSLSFTWTNWVKTWV